MPENRYRNRGGGQGGQQGGGGQGGGRGGQGGGNYYATLDPSDDITKTAGEKDKYDIKVTLGHTFQNHRNAMLRIFLNGKFAKSHELAASRQQVTITGFKPEADAKTVKVKVEVAGNPKQTDEVEVDLPSGKAKPPAAAPKRFVMTCGATNAEGETVVSFLTKDENQVPAKGTVYLTCNDDMFFGRKKMGSVASIQTENNGRKTVVVTTEQRATLTGTHEESQETERRLVKGRATVNPAPATS